MKQSSDNIKHCPPPRNITFGQRMALLIGRTMTVYTTGFPILTKITGRLTKVTADSFTVGKTVILFDSSFYIVLHKLTTMKQPYKVTVTAEDIGTLRGILIFSGKNFVEFIQVPGRHVPTIFPLNQFSELNCDRIQSHH